MGITESGYYSLRHILSYSDCTYYIVLSDRGRGKSWDAHWYFLQQPGLTMCVTRQAPDMIHQISDFLDPYLKGDADHEPIAAARFSFEGSKECGFTLLFDGAPKFLFRTLTMVNAIKQESFPDDLDWVWLDEFIPLVYKKLPGVESEGDALRTIMKTIDHDTAHPRETRGLRKLRCLMFANPFTWNNPILSYFKIIPRIGIFRVGPGVVCEILPPYEKTEGKMTVDDFLGDEVNRNQGWQDQDAFVCSRPKNARPLMSLRLQTRYYTIYTDLSLLHVRGASQHPKSDILYYGTLDGLRENESCIEGSRWLDLLKTRAYGGRMRFESMNIKFDFLRDLTEVR